MEKGSYLESISEKDRVVECRALGGGGQQYCYGMTGSEGRGAVAHRHLFAHNKRDFVVYYSWEKRRLVAA